jgi:hypothetical protein
MPPEIDEQTIGLIADRVTASLRRELELIANELTDARRPLTVEDVANRFGVARSTVYAHWREWGGYKLGSGDKSAIRFDEKALPIPPNSAPGNGSGRRRPGPGLLTNNPEAEQTFDIRR